MFINKVTEALIKYQPMSIRDDLYVTIEILKFAKPKVILELGTGNGGWILATNELCPINACYIGYENFILNYGLDWHSNGIDLENYLKNTSNSSNIEIKNLDVKNILPDTFINYTFDIVRLDCLESQSEVSTLFEKIYPYTSPNCIFIVDDIVPNNCPGRFLSFMENTKNKLIKPIWFGNKEGAWVKQTYEESYLQMFLKSSMDNILKYEQQFIDFYGTKYSVVLTYGSYK